MARALAAVELQRHVFSWMERLGRKRRRRDRSLFDGSDVGVGFGGNGCRFDAIIVNASYGNVWLDTYEGCIAIYIYAYMGLLGLYMSTSDMRNG